MKDRQYILGTKVLISDYELISRDLKDVQKMIKERVSHDLARAIVENDLVTLEESPAFDLHSKEVRAEVVVLDRDEFNRLKRIERASKEATDTLTKSFYEKYVF